MKPPDHSNGRVLALVVTPLASAAVVGVAAAAPSPNLKRLVLQAYTGKGPKIGPFKDAFKGESILKLPAYGDEQYADYLPKPTRPHGQLIVRKGSVVWYLTVEDCTPLAASCYGTSRTEAPIAKAQATLELTKYGAKQKARAGAGR